MHFIESYVYSCSTAYSSIIQYITAQDSSFISVNSDGLFQLSFRDGLFFILLFLLVLIAFVKISGKNYFRRISTSLVNYSYSNSFFKEKNLAHSLFNIILLIVFFISFSIFISVLVQYFKLSFSNDNRWFYLFIFFVATVSIVILHTLIYIILGFLTKNSIIASQYLFFFFNLLRVLAVLIVILLFGSVFSISIAKTVFIYFSFFVLIIALFIRMYRIILIFFDNRFPLYYMILYFCALEIVPTLLFIKLFNHYIFRAYL